MNARQDNPTHLTAKEAELIQAYRNATEKAQDEAIVNLLDCPRDQQQSD